MVDFSKYLKRNQAPIEAKEITMQDEFMATYGNDSGPKEIPTKGLHQAVCAQVHSLGFQVFKGQVSFSPKCVFVFELDEKMKNGEMAGKPFVVSEKHGLYMGKPGKASNLRKFLEKWKEKAYTEEEAKNTNIKKCERVPCTLNIDHEPKDGGGFRAKIVGIGKPDPTKTRVPVTYTETPKWIVKEKSEAVPNPNQAVPSVAATGGGAPSQGEDDLPF